MIREPIQKPSARKRATLKPPSRKETFILWMRKLCAQLRKELSSFHFWVDFTTMAASLAAVFTLILLLHDRTEQTNVVAWTLLQNYLQNDQRPQFNEGQDFALETLAKNKVPVPSLDGHDIYLGRAEMRGLEAMAASFRNARFYDDDLSYAFLFRADFQNAKFTDCHCGYASFHQASFSHADVLWSDFVGAVFDLADISDLKASESKFSRNAFVTACYEKGHPPQLVRLIPPNGPYPIDADFNGYNSAYIVEMPREPQGKKCEELWSKTWAERDKRPVTPRPAPEPSTTLTIDVPQPP